MGSGRRGRRMGEYDELFVAPDALVSGLATLVRHPQAP